MLTVLALALMLASPADLAESQAAPARLVVTGSVAEPPMYQIGLTDMTTLKRTGDLVDVWQYWVPYSPVGDMVYVRRRFTFDCAARTDRMTAVEAYNLQGVMIRQMTFDKPDLDTPIPGSNGEAALAFICEGVVTPMGRIEYASIEEALPAVRQYMRDKLGAR